ncbi:hypothetical protein ACFE04_030989 [Oxalis oulophora]
MDSQQQQQEGPSLEECLKLLRGERDEQRLAGLLLVTKSSLTDHLSSLPSIYHAVGTPFLHRLLKTGMGKGLTKTGTDDAGNRDAYLRLSLTVLSAFCRLPEIASSHDMVVIIPLILEILSNESVPPCLEECYEILFLVSSASEEGVTKLYESGGMKVIASQMSSLPDGSHAMQLAMKLVPLMLSKITEDIPKSDYVAELSMMVVAIAKQFSVLHNALKFEALHLLSAIFSSSYAVHVQLRLREMASTNWPNDMREGIVAILQNRVAPTDKLEALILAHSVVSIMGERWLIGQPSSPDIPADRCLLLVLETSRVEVAVLLNELAYLRYEVSKNSSSTAESIMAKQRNVDVCFSLVERIIKLISSIAENEGSLIGEGILTMVINGLNETINLVLEYLNDAKEHRQNKGNDLLASVRLVGSYLAETPIAFKQKVDELLLYMLSVESEDEPRPFYSVCFLLPFLCQITMEPESCKKLVSSRGYKAVVECLLKLIGPDSNMTEDNDCIFLACDTILNLLLKKEQLKLVMDETTYVPLLKALASWTEKDSEKSVVMMAASILSQIFDYTSEEALVNHPDFKDNILGQLYRVIARSLTSSCQDTPDSDMDLHDIISSGYSRWGHRFPGINSAYSH